MVQCGYGENDGEFNEPLVQNMYNKALKLSIVEPGDTLSGFLFFDTNASNEKSRIVIAAAISEQYGYFYCRGVNTVVPDCGNR